MSQEHAHVDLEHIDPSASGVFGESSGVVEAVRQMAERVERLAARRSSPLPPPPTAPADSPDESGVRFSRRPRPASTGATPADASKPKAG